MVLGASWITAPTLLATGIFARSLAVKVVVEPIDETSIFCSAPVICTACSAATKLTSLPWPIRTCTSPELLVTAPLTISSTL